MLSLIVFVVCLVLITFLFLIKGIEIYYGKKIMLERFFLKCDHFISLSISKIKFWVKQITLKNIKLIFSWIMVSIGKMVIAVKRRFDHQQSHFFTKRERPVSKNKNSVSFFLKHVSDYKKTLKESIGDKEIRD
jgi:hypothetical protein